MFVRRRGVDPFADAAVRSLSAPLVGPTGKTLMARTKLADKKSASVTRKTSSARTASRKAPAAADRPSADETAPTPDSRVASIPALLTVNDMAELFGRSRSAIYRAVQEKRLPPPRDVGAGRRWLGEDVAGLISRAKAVR